MIAYVFNTIRKKANINKKDGSNKYIKLSPM